MIHHDLQDLQVVVEAPDALPPLPAAVEVASLRIVEEALTNVATHAQARSCSVKLALAGNGLGLVIQDDGIGMPKDCQPGAGLRSMAV
jgi:signal transduction histidine kinase